MGALISKSGTRFPPRRREDRKGHDGVEAGASGQLMDTMEIPAIVLHVEVSGGGGTGAAESSEQVWAHLQRAIAESGSDVPITLGGDDGGEGTMRVQTTFRLRVSPPTYVDGPGTVKPLVLL